MKIVILGNGFDLASGLKSSYKDFFDFKKEEINTIKKKLDSFIDSKIESIEFKKEDSNKSLNYNNYEKKIEIEQKNEINKIYNSFNDNVNKKAAFWYVHFQNKTDINNWCDVETEIKNLLFDKDFIKAIMHSDKTMYKSTSYTSAVLFPQYEIQRELSRYGSDIFLNCDKEKKKNIFLKMLLCHDENEKIYESLKNSLIAFEKEFQDYIKKQFDKIKKKRLYLERYNKNLEELVYNETYLVYVINFNFTSIDIKKNSLGYKEKYKLIENNVHGNMKENIIFGIDSEKIKIEKDVDCYKFTKTYRKMNEMKIIKKSSIPKSEGKMEIIFFGHSLADADYSYFQSLFDFYDIYNAEIILVFKYMIYEDDRKTSEQQKEEYLEKVARLMEKYGQSFDNNSHGKNLLHKLLLENRLSIEEVKGVVKPYDYNEENRKEV